METDQLVLYYDYIKQAFRIKWLLTGDENDTGASLGEYGPTEDCPSDGETVQNWTACEVCRDSGIARDNSGYFWETEHQAARSLREIRERLKHARECPNWPEWAVTAKSEGWKPPKGWQP